MTNREEKIKLLTRVFNYFRGAVNNSQPGRDYIAKRGLALHLEIGYNTGQFHHGKRRDPQLISLCVKYGLLTPTQTRTKSGEPTGYYIFGRNCIVFPLKDKGGQVTGLYFRSIIDNNESKPASPSGRHFYLKDREGLYPGYPTPNTEKLILTEAIIDAATLLMNNEKLIMNNKKIEILACYGTNGLTDEHKAAIAGLKKLQEIIFAFDGDAAGREGIKRTSEILSKLKPGIKITYLDIPGGEDINSLATTHEPGIFTHLIETRKELFLLPELLLKETQEPGTRSQDEQQPKEINQSTIGNNPSSLDTSNPLSLKYQGAEAEHRIKGFNPRQSDSLRISLQIINTETRHDHRSKLDLYEYKQVKQTAKEAAERLALRNDFLERDLFVLTTLLEDYRDRQLQNLTNGGGNGPKIKVNEAVSAKCIEFLSKPKLIKHINELIGMAGVAGEENSRILLFTVASSYKMPDTLHALIQGSSGSGKTKQLKIISSLMPPEDVKSYTRVTDNSFYNQDEYFFVHQLLCFEDIDGLKEDAQLAVRELQSNEILRTSTSIKDDNGHIRGGERTVRGPIASLACTTHGELYEDNMSRLFIIAVDESKAQTLRIISYQNNRAAGIIDIKKEKEVREFLQNCIRLLKPYQVINPYANQIHLPEEVHKLRRLNELYQSFVKQITLLNQYQRKKDKEGRLITEIEDLQTACDILFESIVLKVDELDGSLRQFFEKLKDYVRKTGGNNYQNYQFTQREIRQGLNISKSQLQRYINDLLALEYISQSGGFQNRGLTYKIIYLDDYKALRERIKRHIYQQLETLRNKEI